MGRAGLIRATPYDDSELLGVVRDVAGLLGVVVPEDLTQAAFDNARAAAGHPAAPTAKRICARLRAAWRVVCATALSPDASPSRFAGRRKGAEERPCSLREAAAALKVVATRRGLNAVSQRAFIEERELLVAADRRRWRHGRRVQLPTVGQMLRGRTWEEIETAAGLPHAAGGSGSEPRDAFQELLNLIELALQTKGALPTAKELEAFAAASGRSQPRRAKPYADCVSALRERRASRGLWTPSSYPPPEQRPDFADVPEEIVTFRRPRAWTRERCVEALSRALGEIRGEATLRRYQRVAAGRPDYPAASTFEQFGGYEAIRAEARLLRRARLERLVAAASG